MTQGYITFGCRCLLFVSVWLAGCEGDEAGRSQTPPAAVRAPFEEVAAATGLVFTHFNGASGAYYQPEVFGPGVGVLDYDNDGDLDVYLPQAAMPDPDQPIDAALFTLPPGQPPGDRLFRNDLVPGGALRFTDVTAAAGVGDHGYAQGVAIGDVDGDGHTDLYVTNFGPNVLYRNAVTAVRGHVPTPPASTTIAGAPAPHSSTTTRRRSGPVSSPATSLSLCGATSAATATAAKHDYCSPSAYTPLTDRLFRNDGDVKFTDVSDAPGIASAVRPRAWREPAPTSTATA